MSSNKAYPKLANSQTRVRLTREERYQQLIAIAWQIIRDEGTEALTLGRLAKKASVTKPVVYDHFGTRSGLLAALYIAFDSNQTEIMDIAIQQSEPTLEKKAAVIASTYINCVLVQGREIPSVIAALAGSPELEKIKREYARLFVEKCRITLMPYTKGGKITAARLWAMLGAAEALSYAAANGDITATEAETELFSVIIAMVERSL
ncbi:TetR/AcrR family transcriptional regulator [Xenorhabdus griffiniae]|uniref:TetR family transcriptional regulator n=1 Tax=Xenorhabdus griffiniae TaxID=351672 RepID=A0ABY9XGA6_9GAMM|nr:TetR family transcriptional regulator [Xenorhabdus griffiniae]MBD1226301.1 TetR/AcrR family transcriptional regulator [Xenorhabdus griffiniae]MBE8586579.1 TetR/AcrR family transcriptional regulator [Xenorhabdus griffiniae]WMV71951.1 TetR family transcriptional regulator [Xenorhabdus griffiniae]WNH01628.1 TetR family transcriptional regulator [Xenorhabdus griffiniae]